MARNAVPFDFDLALDDAIEPGPARVSAALVGAIAAGRLRDGDLVPSTRTIARALALPRSMLVAAYEELVAAGFLDSRMGAGTTVAHGAELAAQAGAFASSSHRKPDQALASNVAPAPAVIAFDLRPGYPDATLLDLPAIHRAFRAAVDGSHHGDHRDFVLLRAALVTYLRRSRGVVCEPGDIFIFPSVPMALRAIAPALLTQDRPVAFEDPGYVAGRQALTGAGVDVRPVSVDHDGIRVDLLREDDGGVYVTPAHQYPLGARMPVGRRADLLAWAGNHGGLVLEDDYDGEFRYDVAPMPAVRAMRDAEDRVIYLGNASKMLTRDLRIAWAVVPTRFRQNMTRQIQRQGAITSPVDARALATLLNQGTLQRHVITARRTYAARRARFSAACQAVIPHIGIEGVTAGLHVVLLLPADVDDVAIVARLATQGVACAPLSAYALDPHGPRGLICGYARLPESRALQVARLIHDVLAAPPS